MAAKYSKQREAIYEYLCNTKSHPDAETIYNGLKQEMPDLSLGTVYRNLARFLSEGRIIRVDNADNVCHYDANTKTHYHFSCTCCGNVYDVDMPVNKAIERESSVEEVGRANNHQLMFYGVCKKCKS